MRATRPTPRAERPTISLPAANTNVPLLHRVSTGDSAAVRECIARFGGLIWSLGKRVGLPDSECEDAVQEIFAEIWANGHKYRTEIASETAFVATIARRRLIDRRRKLGREGPKQALTEATVVPPAATRDSALPDEAQRAAKALTQLSAEQQRVLRLSVYEGLSHELIARSTGLPLGTVKTHARRGLIRLREILGDSAAAGAPDGPRSGGPVTAAVVTSANGSGPEVRGEEGTR